jgi:hemin uptake protein HemP
MSSLLHGDDLVDPSSAPVRTAGRTTSRSPQIISSKTLFGARQELHIEHSGCLYRLRITRNGKLILTK